MGKLAFLFLIYDEINNEELWRNFFRGIGKSKYSIYIHYKMDKRLKFFESFKLRNTVPTEYADSSIVKAQNLLLYESLKDIENSRFIFLSNSCIPLKNFSHIYNALFEKEVCHFNLSMPEHVFEHGRGENLLRFFGRNNVRKASQWCILTRDIAGILSESNGKLEEIFEHGMGARDLPDEYFYISYLFSLNKHDLLHLSNYSATNCTTFEYWDDKDYFSDGPFTTTHPDNWDRRLKTYCNISENELMGLLNAPCLFGRKFSKDCMVSDSVDITERISMYYHF